MITGGGEQQGNVTFSGGWNETDTAALGMLLAPVFAQYPGVEIECWYRTFGVTYKANVRYRGREFGPVAYGLEALVQNIKSCLPLLAD